MSGPIVPSSGNIGAAEAVDQTFLNSIINMVLRLVMRRIVSKGINVGMDAATSRMSKGRPEGAPIDSGPTQKRAKQTMRMARKIGRM